MVLGRGLGTSNAWSSEVLTFWGCVCDIDSLVSGIVEGGIVAPNVCANCGASDDLSPGGVKLMPCSVCKTAKYCERGCQVRPLTPRDFADLSLTQNPLPNPRVF